jgi:IS5 family transposase
MRRSARDPSGDRKTVAVCDCHDLGALAALGFPNARAPFLAPLKAPHAQDFTNRKGTRNKPLSDAERGRNRTKSKVRARVEHPFHVIKQVFGFVKVRYRGLMKNTSRIHMLCALANLHMARRRLLRLQPA